MARIHVDPITYNNICGIVEHKNHIKCLPSKHGSCKSANKYDLPSTVMHIINANALRHNDGYIK